MIDLEQSHYGFQDLLEIMARLRQKEGGCPWDLAQTHESIRRNFIEEAYEAAEAIDQRDDAHLCEELGDVLLQVVFHAQIGLPCPDRQRGGGLRYGRCLHRHL